MSSSGAAATSAAAVTSSRGGNTPAAVPAAELTGGTNVSGRGVGPPAAVGASPTPPAPDPSVGAGAATEELLVTEQEQEQLVASGGRREVLAGVSRMAGGTSPVGPDALPAGSPGPPGPPPTSEEMWAGMVHDGGADGCWQGQRVTPAVTRSRAKRDGLRPGMFALMTTQGDPRRTLLSKNCHRSWPVIWRRRRRTFRQTSALIAAFGRRRRARN